VVLFKDLPLCYIYTLQSELEIRPVLVTVAKKKPLRFDGEWFLSYLTVTHVARSQITCTSYKNEASTGVRKQPLLHLLWIWLSSGMLLRVDVDQATQCCIPEDNELRTHRPEKLKSRRALVLMCLPIMGQHSEIIRLHCLFMISFCLMLVNNGLLLLMMPGFGLRLRSVQCSNFMRRGWNGRWRAGWIKTSVCSFWSLGVRYEFWSQYRLSWIRCSKGTSFRGLSLSPPACKNFSNFLATIIKLIFTNGPMSKQNIVITSMHRCKKYYNDTKWKYGLLHNWFLFERSLSWNVVNSKLCIDLNSYAYRRLIWM
jgi:hypothetical protein